jgi:hypothetical protein
VLAIFQPYYSDWECNVWISEPTLFRTPGKRSLACQRGYMTLDTRHHLHRIRQT